MPSIEINLDLFSDEAIQEEFTDRKLIKDLHESDLIDELEDRGFICRNTDKIRTEDLIDLLGERSLSNEQRSNLMDIIDIQALEVISLIGSVGLTEQQRKLAADEIGATMDSEVIPLKDYDTPTFERLEDTMKMELVMEHIGRFSLNQLFDLFCPPMQKTA